MILKIVEGKTIKDVNNLYIMDCFKGISDMVLTYASFMWDYGSVFRMLPEANDIRENAIRKKVNAFKEQTEANFKDWRYKNKTHIGRAKKQIMELQYDDDYETYKALKENLSELSQLLAKKDKTEDEIKLSLTISKQLLDIRETKEKYEKLVGERIAEDESSISKKRTSIERYQEAKKDE